MITRMEVYQYSLLPPRNIRLLYLYTGSNDDERIAELTLPLKTANIVEFSTLLYA